MWELTWYFIGDYIIKVCIWHPFFTQKTARNQSYWSVCVKSHCLLVVLLFKYIIWLSIYFIFYSLIGLLQKTLFHWKKRIRSLKMEWWEAGDLQFYMYGNEHQKWPLQNMYYTSLLVNTWPRSMISHIKIMSPRTVPLGASLLSHHVTSPAEPGESLEAGVRCSCKTME